MISDQIWRLTTYKSSKSYPEEIRLVVYEDYATSTVYSFMTNDFDLPALSIAKKKHDLAISLYTFAQTLGLTLFEKTPIKELFNNKDLINNLSDENQLSLWNS